jgi:hypothetical protein
MHALNAPVLGERAGNRGLVDRGWLRSESESDPLRRSVGLAGAAVAARFVVCRRQAGSSSLQVGDETNELRDALLRLTDLGINEFAEPFRDRSATVASQSATSSVISSSLRPSCLAREMNRMRSIERSL